LTDEQRDVFRQTSKRSQASKRNAINGLGPEPIHQINIPKLDPADLMPERPNNHLRTLSLFSGGGGLDLGFERAGFTHIASYEIMSDAAKTLSANRPKWHVFAGIAGDVTGVDWRHYAGTVDIVHGGPPCQPFSSAGRQMGAEDQRDLFPEFVRVVREISPAAFVVENVKALLSQKFQPYVQGQIVKPLSSLYTITVFAIKAAEFGIPQIRNRVFVVGLRRDKLKRRFMVPQPTHSIPQFSESVGALEQGTLWDLEQSPSPLPLCMGAREALGLPDTGVDGLAPTIRSGLTGPRHTTSILSSVSALREWNRLGIWPNGVARDRYRARQFITQNRHFRLSVPDCSILQGFPESWHFCGAVYMSIGQIGNSVAPPMAYAVARSVVDALS
jgi:DNA (cytosine-5)-methyltransferase 1